ncbi:MAG: site-specific integrase [Nitrospirae bacterium]|nr:site-specific integrase [Nitrospirota bacterium]
MKGISAKAGLAYALKYAAEQLAKGIGISRHKVQNMIGGQSKWIHGSNTHRRYMSVARDFVNQCKANSVNRLDKVTQGTVAGYFERRLQCGVTQATLKVEISAINKFLVDGLGRKDLLITNGQAVWRQAESGSRAYPFDNPQLLIDAIKEPAAKAIAKIEYHTSARIAETKNIRIDEKNKTVSIIGKGGKERDIDYSGRTGKFETIKEAKNILENALQERSWHQIRTESYQYLHQAERAIGEIIQGFHGFRASYISERYEEKYEQYVREGKTEDEADRLADLAAGREAGHERADTTRHYRMA